MTQDLCILCTRTKHTFSVIHLRQVHANSVQHFKQNGEVSSPRHCSKYQSVLHTAALCVFSFDSMSCYCCVMLTSKVIQGDILEDIALIENLEETKRTAVDIAEKVKQAKETELSIGKAREVYCTVATRGSLVYFLIDTLNALDRCYHYSMANFVYILRKGEQRCSCLHYMGPFCAGCCTSCLPFFCKFCC